MQLRAPPGWGRAESIHKNAMRGTVQGRAWHTGGMSAGVCQQDPERSQWQQRRAQET